MKRTPVSVVVQTHWDREWYYPRETYAARLVRVMKRVVPMLQANALKYFLLDGQTAALEDLRAEAESALLHDVEELIRAGRILLGPWYISADEFLISGESLIRNLEQGTRDVAQMAPTHEPFVGYLPDTFGHAAQMPLILAQFGIDRAVLWRGADAPHSEFDWAALDGTRVPTIYLTEGYYQHPLNLPDDGAALKRYLDTILPRSLAGHLLLTQGGDHLAPDTRLTDRMTAMNQGASGYELAENTLRRYADLAIQATQGRRAVLAGELRSNKSAFVLPDVLSTRRYLKHAHQWLEDRLLGEVEPLLAMLMPTACYPWRYLNETWRQLIQNQAHDSICGCSVDEVHREMQIRFEKLAQRCDALVSMAAVDGGLQSETRHQGGPAMFADDAVFTLFNPLPHRATGPHYISLFLAGDADTITLLDEGEAVVSATLHVTAGSEFRSPLDDFPDRLTGHHYRVALWLPLDGLQAKTLTVRRTTRSVAGADATPRTIHNHRYRVTCANGSLTLEDAATQTLYPSFLAVMSELDAGDTYNFSPPPNQTVSRSAHWQLVKAEQTSEIGRMLVSIGLTLPAGLNSDRTGAGSERVSAVGELEILLAHGDVPLRCSLKWTNAGKDQRTRLLLRWRNADEVGETMSDTAFAFTSRENVRAAYPTTLERREMPVAVQPSYSTIVAHPFYINHRAMHEYEVVKDRDTTYLGLTLVRSVGWLSRRDLVTRGVGAGPDMPTPGSQCRLTDTFDFSLGCLEGSDTAVRALVAGRALRRPVIKLRGRSTAWRAGPTLISPEIEVSAVRRVQDGTESSLELRLWNPTGSRLVTGLSANEWRAVRADGAALADTVDTVAPYSLLTVRQQRPT